MPKCDRCAWHEYLSFYCVLDPNYPHGCHKYKPKKPTFWHKILCVVIILALQALMTTLNIWT